MKTSVVGVRLNDYQRDKLKAIGKDSGLLEVDILRILADKLIEGRIHGKVIKQGREKLTQHIWLWALKAKLI